MTDKPKQFRMHIQGLVFVDALSKIDYDRYLDLEAIRKKLQVVENIKADVYIKILKMRES